jgi:hypothetical protein
VVLGPVLDVGGVGMLELLDDGPVVDVVHLLIDGPEEQDEDETEDLLACL